MATSGAGVAGEAPPLVNLRYLVAALAILAVLTLQGLGILLPTNLRGYLEIRKSSPDLEQVGRGMRRYMRVVALQGVLQVAIIAIMAHFATGL